MKNDSPRISIIVPVYNVENYLSRCIESVLAQSFRNYELLLIDDGSNDSSDKICDDYALKDTRIVVFHKANGGVSSARNVGLDNAKGEWVYFCDADDELFPEGLQTLLSNTDENTLLSFGCHQIVREDETISTVGRVNSSEISVRDFFEWLFTCKPYYQGFLWNKLFKRNIIEKAKLRFDTTLYFNEDRLFIVQYLCSRSGIIYFVDSHIYIYYECNGGAMSSLEKGFNCKFFTDLDAFSKILQTIKDAGFDEVLDDAKKAMFLSYFRIKSMMRKWNVKDIQIEKKLKKQIFNEMSLNEYKLFAVSTYLQIGITKIKNMKKKLGL